MLPLHISPLFSLWFYFLCISLHFVVVVQSCPAVYDCMDYTTPGLPVLHHLPELHQTDVH